MPKCLHSQTPPQDLCTCWCPSTSVLAQVPFSPRETPLTPLPSYVALCHLLLWVLLFPVRDNTGPPQGAGRGSPQVTQLHREGLSKHDPW